MERYPVLNENPSEQFIPNEISLMIEPASVDPKIILSPYSYPIPLEDPITGEFYYSQKFPGTSGNSTPVPEICLLISSQTNTIGGALTRITSRALRRAYQYFFL